MKISYENAILILGIVAQTMFTGRFFVQWVASERKKESVIPVSFWYLSLSGGLLLLLYAILRKDPVFMFGQAAGTVVYIRNIMMIRKKSKDDKVKSEIEVLDELSS